MNAEEKIMLTPISPFEFVIMSYADPEEAKKHRAYTDEEVYNQRKENLQRQLDNITTPSPK